MFNETAKWVQYTASSVKALRAGVLGMCCDVAKSASDPFHPPLWLDWAWLLRGCSKERLTAQGNRQTCFAPETFNGASLQWSGTVLLFWRTWNSSGLSPLWPRGRAAKHCCTLLTWTVERCRPNAEPGKGHMVSWQRAVWAGGGCVGREMGR